MFGLRPDRRGRRLLRLGQRVGSQRRGCHQSGRAEQDTAAAGRAIFGLVQRRFVSLLLLGVVEHRRLLLHCDIIPRLSPLHATETEVASRSIDRFRVTGGRPVAAAIVGCAQMRATLDDLARDFDVRLPRVVATVFAATARILRNAAGLRRIGLMLPGVPIGRPFPDIADHVVQAVAVRRKRGHR